MSNEFPIVGIGASAGGPDAFKALLKSLPPDTGAAFILIQHLDPNHDSMMAGLLSRQTAMPVLQAESATRLQPNHVYVIPPNKFIRLADEDLILDEPVRENGIRLSVDYFFRSLAKAGGGRAVAVVLSGTGGDGALGIREIKAAGGMVMVQAPEEAAYDGMPRTAIETGAVDFVVPLSQMADRLVSFLRHPRLEEPTGADLPEGRSGSLQEILRLLREQTEFDFQSYKKGTIERRIQRRMGLRHVARLEDYVAHLRQSPDEVHLLSRDLLIGVTRFFREPEFWQALGDKVLDALIARTPRGVSIRAWIPGCATGEDAYTLAMVLFDRIDRLGVRVGVQIFATDLNDRAIEAARAGRYAATAAADIPEPMLRKFFTEEGDAILVDRRLREAVVFATQNVIADPPFSRLDLIVCRNLMIYLEADVQRRMIEMFHFALSEQGHLFLGSSESAERPGRLFEAVDKSARIYRRAEVGRGRAGSFPVVAGARRSRASQPDPVESGSGGDIGAARRQMMDRFVPAAVMIDRSQEVRYFHGPVRNYLDFPAGEPTSLLPEIVMPALRTKLRSVVGSVLKGARTADTVVSNVRRNGHEASVRITAETLGGAEGLIVYFEDVTEPKDAGVAERARTAPRANPSAEDRDDVASLEYELHSTREDLQSIIEEMETANEELRASNEEVMSMNQELQSTNEELETSREELQSLNEELSTVNSQLQDKVEELERTNNDLTNLLVSTDIGVIFLDTDLTIRRFTPAVSAIMRIAQSDVGRSVEDIAMRVRDAGLIADARQALDKLLELEAEVAGSDGRDLIRRVRPYRTSGNRIDGVVVTYTDVSNLQEARRQARRREAQQAAAAELGRKALGGTPLAELLDLAVAEVATLLGVRYVKFLQLDPDRRHLTLRSGVGFSRETPGVTKVGTGVESQAGFTLERSAPVIVRDFAEEKRFTAPPLLQAYGIRCGASVIIGPVEDPWGVLGAHETEVGRCGFTIDDINFMQLVAHIVWLVVSRDRSIAELERERGQLSELIDALPILFAVIGKDGEYEFANRTHAAWGVTGSDPQGQAVVEAVHAETGAAVAARLEAALRGEPQTFEVELFGTRPRAGLASYVPRVDASGTVTGIYAACIDITEQKRLEHDLAERFDQYRVLGESIPFGVWITDGAGRLTYASQSFLDLVGMTMDEARDDGWLKALPPHRRDDTRRAWEEALAADTTWEREHDFRGTDGEVYHVLALGRPIHDLKGRTTSWVGLNLDITSRKEEERRLAVISAELDHRVKNILATVSTIARMTGKTATSVAGYRVALEARLQAMAAAHKLLAESDWKGMDIRALIETELHPYLASHPAKIEIGGDSAVHLSPAMVQLFALALHELTTNSAKYGALASEDGGQLTVRWRSGDDRHVLEWIESGLTGVEAPSREGFGTTLLTRVLAAQDVDVSLEFLDTGLQARIAFETLAPRN